MKAKLVLGLVSCLGWACSATPGEANRAYLFVIERSKNANVVTYEMSRDKDGAVDREDPVAVYWVMKAEEGGREDLRRIEHRAYGFSVRWLEGKQLYLMTLNAFPARGIQISEHGGESAAYIEIAGAPARLQKIWIETDEGGLLPGVKFVELIGTDRKSGKPVREKVMAD